MTSYRDIPSGEFIATVAESLKQMDAIQPPEWAPYVKTGVHRERTPTQPDWWYLRTAALLRKVAMRGPIGTERLSRFYGGPVDRGSKPNRSVGGSRSIIRKALQQLEAAELVQVFKENKVNRGRCIPPQGQSLLAGCAKQLAKA